MSQALGLDHVGVVGPDLALLAGEFERLGFHLTPLARHAGGRTANRCIMLQGTYLELLSTIDGGSSATIERFLARYAGAHIIALRIDDEAAALVRLRRAWDKVPDASTTDRAIDDTEPDRPRVRFSLITPPDPPEGRMHLIRHLTPALLWPEPLPPHGNATMALREVMLAVSEPARTASWFSLSAGRPVVPDPDGGYALELPRGRVRLLPAAGLAASLPGTGCPTLPCIAGLALLTNDDNVALKKLLSERAIPHRTRQRAVFVDAGGITLKFLGTGR